LIYKQAEFPPKQFRSLLNGVLVQERDLVTEETSSLKTVTNQSPTPTEIEDLIFANKIVKHTKSNTIVLAKTNSL